MRISTPEMAMLNLVAYPRRAGGWSHIESLLPDLAAASSRRGWQDALGIQPPTSHVQRLGYLLERAGAPFTDVHAVWLRSRRRRAITLAPGGGRQGLLDPSWNVFVDPSVKPD